MRVLYDDQIFTMQEYGGISRYFAEIINIYNRSEGIDYRITTRFTQNSYALKYNLINNTLLQSLESLIYLKMRALNFVAVAANSLNLKYKMQLFEKKNYDVFHPTYYDPYFLDLIEDKPLIVTAHDMIHELFPEMYSLDDIRSQLTPQWKQAVFSRADKIIAVSENTKNDLVRIAGINANKITVVYHASSIRLEKGAGVGIALPDRYILFVGERIRYKNFVSFIRAIAKLLQKDRTLFVVCAGGRALTDAEKQLFTDLCIDGQVLQYTVNDGLLAYLYSKALMFVFPSLYEGFGMPILEAFSCGCPVVLSNASSLPEVADEAALYFDPRDNNSILAAVETVLHDRELREKLVKAGMQRSTHFSWEKAAMETRLVYESVVQKSH